jgi:hypothetical protein
MIHSCELSLSLAKLAGGSAIDSLYDHKKLLLIEGHLDSLGT